MHNTPGAKWISNGAAIPDRTVRYTCVINDSSESWHGC